MNFTRNKMILYMLIIATGIDFILPWPIFTPQIDSNVKIAQPYDAYEARFSRQVVQPTWLNVDQEGGSNQDATVNVDQEALEEAEEIRRTIQEAVNEDRYAVNDEQQSPNVDNLPTFTPSEQAPPQQQPPMHALPNWYLNVQKLWQNWSQNLFKGFRN